MYSMKDAANRTGTRLIAILGMTLGLAACGGGSDSAPASGGVILPTAPVTITSTNQAEVAGAASDTAFGATYLGAMGAQTSVDTKSAVDIAQRVAQVGGATAKQIGTQAEAPATATGVAQTYDCLYGGTYAVDYGATSATSSYTNCSDVQGETINGTMVMSNISYTANGMTANTTFNLSFTWTGGSGTATGDMHLAMDFATWNTTLSGTSLTFTDSVTGNSGMQNYSITTDINGNVTAMTFTFASVAVNGTATFSLATPFTYNFGGFPNSGSGVITGGNSTKLRVTILGDEYAPVGSQVQLELSTDNGTTYGTPVYVTWASISRNL